MGEPSPRGLRPGRGGSPKYTEPKDLLPFRSGIFLFLALLAGILRRGELAHQGFLHPVIRQPLHANVQPGGVHLGMGTVLGNGGELEKWRVLYD